MDAVTVSQAARRAGERAVYAQSHSSRVPGVDLIMLPKDSSISRGAHPGDKPGPGGDGKIHSQREQMA